MAFQHASAPLGQRASAVLSADNGKPDRFALMDALRLAAAALDLGPSVIATVDALLSCLPPKRNHDLVFASNATLALRRNGISDRTLRRHLAELISAGLVLRIDSPNGKRYAKRDPQSGNVLRFGIDLAPLFAAFDRITALAQAQGLAAARAAYLRTKLRLAIRARLAADPDCPTATEAQRSLRRIQTPAQLDASIAALDALMPVLAYAEHPMQAEELSASNGQNVRHQQTSKKEIIDRSTQAPADTAPEPTVTLDDLTEACPQAAAFLPEKLRTQTDIITHARRLAPMIGIDTASYDAAEAQHGPLGTAVTIWALLERHDRILQPGAYFRAITSGQRRLSFDPWQWITQLIRKARQAARNCPRTMSTASAALAHQTGQMA